MQRALISIPKQREPSPIARACQLLATSHVKHVPVESLLNGSRRDDLAAAIISRGAVPLGTTGNDGFAAQLDGDAIRDFLVDLAPYGAGARLVELAVKGAVGPVTVRYPVRTSGAVIAPWVREGGAIPVRTTTFGLVDLGPAKKLIHILPWSSELSKRTDADQIFETMLREDVAAGLDAAMLSDAAESDDGCAGLLHGVDPLTGYGGGDVRAIEEDLIALSDEVTSGGSGSVTFLMAPARAARLRIKAPTLARDLDIAVSTGIPANRLIAVDARNLIVSVADPVIERATAAALHLDDAPSADIGGATTSVVSLWQIAASAARLTYELAFVKRRSNAVAVLDGATW